MNDVDFLADQLQRAYRGAAWHGPSLSEVLTGVTAEQAAAKPNASLHSIWEITLHMAAWISAVRRRLAGDVAELSDAEDWPAIDSTSAAAWRQSLAALEEQQNRLREATGALADTALKSRVTGTEYSVRFMLNGVIQHNLYHAGQIALLKKMV
jgi:uncharacterized damage-inducible protein DinB